MIRRRLPALLPLVVAALVPRVAAADVRFEARVASENVTLDQPIDVLVTLERDGTQPFEGYRPPTAPPDLELVHNAAGPSQVLDMNINGHRMVKVVETHEYSYRAKKKGTFTLGPAQVKVGGQTLQTKPIVIHVAPVPKNALSSIGQNPPPNAPPTLAPPPDSARGDEDLFVDARTDKPKVYVGEQVTGVWRLYTQTDVLRYRPVAEPRHEDFWSEDLFVPAGHLGWDRQIVKGREYAVSLLLKKALFPLKAGKLTVSPLEVEATTLQSAFYSNASAVRKSPPLTVEVLPLPSAGRPPGFESTNVGQLELVATVDREKIKATESVTWRVTLRGAGNVRSMRLAPLPPIEGWKVYDPTVKERVEKGEVVKGEKTWTYLLAPQKGGALTIPSVSLAYFDPAQGKYQVAKTQSFTLTVEGTPTQVAAGPIAAPGENVLSVQIRPIRNRQTVRSHVGESLWRGRLGVALLAGPPAAWLLVLVGDALRRRLARETAGSRRRRARRAARRRMRAAEYHIKMQRPSAFFGECARIVYEHLEYRLGQKMESYTLSELRGVLEQRGFSRETAEAVVKELETCDFARFAPSASGPGEMRAALRRVRTLLDWIEKARPAEKEAA